MTTAMATCILQGCIYVDDWSREHHARLSERFKLLAHHFIVDGKYKEAGLQYKQSLDEAKLAKLDRGLQASTELEMANALFLSGDCKAALQLYKKAAELAATGLDKEQIGAPISEHDLDWYTAQALTGEGFAQLKLGKRAEAKSLFASALQLFKKADKPRTGGPTHFPIDLCPECCKWGLSISGPQHATKPIVSNTASLTCLSTRLLVGKMLSGDSTKYGAQLPDTIGEDVQNQWESLMRGGQRSLGDKDLLKAERFYKSALDLLDRYKDHGPRLQANLQKLSMLYIREGKEVEAMPLFQREVDLKRQRFGANSSALGPPLCRLGILQVHHNQTDLAEKTLNEALSVGKNACGPDSEVMAIACNNMAELRIIQHRDKEALHYLNLARPIFAKDPNKYRIRLVNIYAMTYACLAKESRFDEARKALVEAVKLLDPTVPHRLQLRVLLPLADFHFVEHDYQSLKDDCERAQMELNLLPKRPALKAEADAMAKHLDELRTGLRGH